ncbi:hypothetical protein NAEGRDRAFT_59833 [Naegleria gruberi]|uniref:ZZ-type domain-containing protein n=1 Tax=Naegleria gruberi TaxID=5762 RepID=D2W1C3_NAEGR|nr:uncharacterized protein NAEGRDRAFT_59833 [Naegleria gruberi]EFC37201.1 hypothetical protein NAEGRDRAFT_59833 [Naegleria gruberi]|eukprot:XP_002669945.1 hypothetical protein NAEGRDRAFT_59833 [Naegleria gruberi strain NEG-M]
MKDIKVRPLHHFLCLFADPVPINNNTQESTTSEQSNNNNSKSRVLFQEKSPEWIMDGIGFKPLFLRVLSFLDEYDLAQSIEPVCKLFRNFALSDALWEPLLFNVMKEKEKWTKEVLEARLNLVKDETSWKQKMIKIVRMYYRDLGCTDLSFSTPGENGYWGVECAECGAKIEHRETYIWDKDSSDNFHIDCFPKDRFYELVENVNQCRHSYGYVERELINAFFKRRIIGRVKAIDEFEEEEEEEQEDLPEFTCDICEEPITGIRYNCLDCGEYDLCGYCCEKIVMKQKGSDLPICKDVDHPHDHIFQTIGEENFDTYSCNACKEKIRGYRYVDPEKDDYDLCTICFYKALQEPAPTPSFERYDVFGNNCIDDLFTEFAKKLLLKELKDVYAELDEESGNLPKKELAEELVNILEEKRDDGKCPFFSKLVSIVPRFCCKDSEGNILTETACNALVHTLEVVSNNEKAAKPPKKKTKTD